MKLLAAALTLFINLTAFAQLKVVKVNKADVPKSLIHKGHIIDVVKYSDVDGEHILLTTETGVKYSTGKDGERLKDAALYAYNYNLTDSNYKLVWKLSEVIQACEFDATARYIPNTLFITDIDKNGVAEIWLMYKTTCTSDVSPLTLKIIMHEGNRKYAMRGETRLTMPGSKPYGGKYTFDPAFKEAPIAIRNYAINLWNKNVDEKFGE